MAKNSKEVQTKADAKRANKREKRTRNWTFLVYPDSAPENWHDIINGDIIPWVESPLHMGENDPQNEGEEKPHWHVIVFYSCVKTFGQVRELTERLNAPIPQMVENTRSMVRYMAHLDQGDKEQFSPQEIICHGGADIGRHLKPLASEELALIAEMQEWVDDNYCLEFFQLGQHAKVERYDDWYPSLVKGSSYIRAYIQSRRNYAKDCQKERAIEQEERRKNTDLKELKET